MQGEKERFLQWVRRGFLLRFHMTFLLLGAFVAGLIVTKILLEVHLNVLWLRYLIAVTTAYVVFVSLIKLWLLYLGVRARRERNSGDLDLPVELAEALCSTGEVSATTTPSFEGGGGQFGGGGATETWASSQAPHSSATLSGNGAGSKGFSVDLDDAIWVVLLAALVLSIFLAGAYLIWAAPTILAEAAFEAALASALARRARKIDSVGWVGSVVRATFWPFAVVLALSAFVGWYAQKRCPSATKIVHAIVCKEPAHSE